MSFVSSLFFSRHLSESESSLEMEEERVYNELSHASQVGLTTPGGPAASAAVVHRTRTVSSPVPVGMSCGPSPGQAGVPGTSMPSTSRPISPGLNYGEGSHSIQRRESGHAPLFTPPPMIHHGRVHSLTTPPGAAMVAGVPSPSPPPPSALPPTGPRRGPVPPNNTPHIPPTTRSPANSSSWFLWCLHVMIIQRRILSQFFESFNFSVIFQSDLGFGAKIQMFCLLNSCNNHLSGTVKSKQTAENVNKQLKM